MRMGENGPLNLLVGAHEYFLRVLSTGLQPDRNRTVNHYVSSWKVLQLFWLSG